MKNKIILGLTGEMSSGKGTAVDYLEKKYNATSHRFSTSLRDVLNRISVDVNRKNMQDLSRILREQFGQNLLAKVISEDAKNDNNNVIVIDGIRRPADIEYLAKLPEFKLIYITASLEKRHERITKRSENKDDKGKTLEEFKKDHEAETEIEIPKIGESAEIKIDNNGSFEDLHAQIDKMIKETLR